ncbi:MAG: Gfo/Idh/MocA family oxidoreductase [Verrucomicrobia bacterium]|nr:Gfo/Idh/MocA family oxidoreductase [Verrucomicrobiota bacterium]
MSNHSNLSRRNFLILGAAAATATAMTGVAQVTNAPAAKFERKLKFGLVGCGKRGAMIGSQFKAHGGFEVVAVADYFPSAADATGEKLGVPANRRFTGLDGYRRLLASGVEAVAIETPPYFHPGQAAAAVDAGVNVYLAKPVAVDVPGCQTVTQSAEKATAKKLCFLVDFQTRATDLFIEAMRRVHAGDIGPIAFAEGIYHCGCPFSQYWDELAKNPHDPEARLRGWGLDRALSGDMITEQNIHTLDVISWAMNRPPVSASAVAALTARRKIGDCSDHFTCMFDYGQGAGVTFNSRQFEGYDTTPSGIRARVFGAKGVLEAECGGQVLIRGETFFKGGKTPGIYREAVAANIAAFYRNITEARYENVTVAPSVQSTMVTLLARTAAYRGETYTWDKLLKNTDRLEPDLKGLKS